MKYYVNIFIALLVAATATGDETHDASMSTYEEEDLAWNAQLPEAMQDYQIKGGGRNGPLWLDYEDLAGEHMCLTVSNNTLSSDHNLRRELLKWDEVLHGCWCGKGSKCGHVVDSVDAACRHHDLCYKKTKASIGNARCHCERNIVAMLVAGATLVIDPISKLPPSPTAIAVRGVGSTLFAFTPCKCRTCIKYPCCKKWRCKWCKKCKTIKVPNFGFCLWD
mmetsp:Transcript_4506/g.7845  ORF Transcript_4506/g.7845 Transcript_4506/m.7845 type:complete len:221 (-) Transcript_4506:118-780(-)